MQHNILTAATYAIHKRRYAADQSDANATRLQKSRTDLAFFLKKLGFEKTSQKILNSTKSPVGTQRDDLQSTLVLAESLAVLPNAASQGNDNGSSQRVYTKSPEPEYVCVGAENGRAVFMERGAAEWMIADQKAKKEFFDDLTLAKETLTPDAYMVHEALSLTRRGLFMSSPSCSAEVEHEVLPKFAVIAINKGMPLGEVVLSDPKAEFLAFVQNSGKTDHMFASFIFLENGTKVKLAPAMVQHMEARLKKAFPDVYERWSHPQLAPSPVTPLPPA